MEISRTTESDLLLAVRRRLIDRIEYFTSQNTWIDDAPLPQDDPKNIAYGCSVSLGESDFTVYGHSICNVGETANIVITPMIRVASAESPPKLTEGIAESTRPFSLLRAKQEILAAILKKSPESHEVWQPTDESGQWLLTEQIAPVSSTGARRAEAWPMLFLSLTFRAPFIWKL